MNYKTKTEHTPGPWRTDYMPSTGFGCGYGKSQIIAANEKAVAGVAAVAPEHGPMYRRGALSQEAFDTLEANADLIAAAPAMLSALHAAHAAFNVITSKHTSAYLIPGVQQAWEAVGRAIAEAEHWAMSEAAKRELEVP